jgi:hypothetical protein
MGKAEGGKGPKRREEVVALALFTIRAIGALAGPLAVLAALLAFAPATFGPHLAGC